MQSLRTSRLLTSLGIAAVLLAGCGSSGTSGEAPPSDDSSQAASSTPAPEAASNLAVERAAAASLHRVGEGAQIIGAAKMKQAIAQQAAGTGGATSDPAECLSIQNKALGDMPSEMTLASVVGEGGTVTFFEDASKRYPQLQKQAYSALETKCRDFTLKASGQTLTQHVEQFVPDGVHGDVVYASSVTTTNQAGEKSSQTAVGVFKGTLGASGTVVGSDDAARQRAVELAKAGMKGLEAAKR